MLDDDENDDDADQGISNYAYDSSSGDDLQNTNTSQALDSDEDTFSTVVTAPGPTRIKQAPKPQEATPAKPVVADAEQFVKLKDLQQIPPDLEVKLGFREGKVKIVQIRENEMIQGILQLEPQIHSTLDFKVTYFPSGVWHGWWWRFGGPLAIERAEIQFYSFAHPCMLWHARFVL